jgi:hypothetical protein
MCVCVCVCARLKIGIFEGVEEYSSSIEVDGYSIAQHSTAQPDRESGGTGDC